MDRKLDIAVSVSHEDEHELASLIDHLNSSNTVGESRSLDGVTLSTAIITIGAASVTMLRDWLVSLVERKKGCVVSFSGVTLQGYSSGEVERMVRLLQQEVGASEQSTEDHDD